jgi:enoyl-CoA hydratase/carnithine racemase
VGIGFFPDVGASYFLSRVPAALGAYLGLSGVPIRGSDALYAGLADVCLPHEMLDTLDSVLAALLDPGPCRGNPRAVRAWGS